MPSSDDCENVKANLDTISKLKTNGSKLSYDKVSGRFSIQEPGIKQSIARTFSPNSVSSEEYFGAPIRELFAAAHAEKMDVAQALEGLKALRRSYVGEKERDKLAKLDAVIKDAELGVKKDPDYVIELRNSYKQYLKFGFAQVMFLPASDPGVCYSFTVHWARRILMGKTYFGKGEEDSPLTLDAEQKARMMRKVDKAIRPLQQELKKVEPSISCGSRVMQLAKEEPHKKYGNLNVFDVCKKQTIDASASGSRVMEKAVEKANLDGKPATIFLVNLRKEKEAHTIGIHLDGALHFFDPNCGEFAFPKGCEQDMESFLDKWWKEFYMERGTSGLEQHFQHWGLENVMLKPS
jgi:Yersinia/Haemophilus virulence surface antigen